MRERPRKALTTLFMLLFLGWPSTAGGAGKAGGAGPDQAPGGPAPETALRERLAKGRLSYRIHCASCHGETGRGDGAMTEILRVRPTDLTRLTASHDGVFPRQEVYEAIDGRRTIRGHGPGAMPVWGLSFQVLGSDSPQEDEIEQRILDLMAFLEIIQEKDAEP